MKRLVLVLFAAMVLAAAVVSTALANIPPPIGCTHIKTHAIEHTPDFVCG